VRRRPLVHVEAGNLLNWIGLEYDSLK